jgi:hypothetical protein
MHHNSSQLQSKATGLIHFAFSSRYIFNLKYSKMHATLFSILGLLISANASPVSPERRDGQNRAAYILDNNPAGASVISLKIGIDDGLLSSPVRTWTGGNGLYGKNANGDAGPDSLFSQDAVVVEQDVRISQLPCLQ